MRSSYTRSEVSEESPLTIQHFVPMHQSPATTPGAATNSGFMLLHITVCLLPSMNEMSEPERVVLFQPRSMAPSAPHTHAHAQQPTLQQLTPLLPCLQHAKQQQQQQQQQQVSQPQFQQQQQLLQQQQQLQYLALALSPEATTIIDAHGRVVFQNGRCVCVGGLDFRCRGICIVFEGSGLDCSGCF